MIRTSKAQAALEFMATYAWAIVMVLIAISALSYFGVLNPKGLVPQRCTLEAGISCPDFTIKEDSVSLLIMNAKGEDLRISSIEIEGCTGTDSGPLRRQERILYEVTGCNNMDSTFSGEVKLIYTGRGGLEHVAKGRIRGNVVEAAEAPTEPTEEGPCVPAESCGLGSHVNGFDDGAGGTCSASCDGGTQTRSEARHSHNHRRHRRRRVEAQRRDSRRVGSRWHR